MSKFAALKCVMILGISATYPGMGHDTRCQEEFLLWNLVETHSIVSEEMPDGSPGPAAHVLFISWIPTGALRWSKAGKLQQQWISSANPSLTEACRWEDVPVEE